MSSGVRRYAAVLRQPGVPRTVGPYLLSRIPSGMVLLALLLFVHTEMGNYGAAGTVTAVFGTSVALTAPMFGRMIDRRGQTGVLILSGFVHPLGLVLTTVAARNGLPLWAVCLPAALSGAFTPPLSPCMRALWPTLIPDETLRATGFAIEAIVIEGTELAGPLLVAACLALGRPATALVVAGVVSGIGALAFSAAPASRAWRPTPRSASYRGALTSRGVRVLLLVVLFSTASFGCLELAVAGFATGHGTSAAAGALIAAWSAGSLAGGLFYGARTWRMARHRQLGWLLGATALGGLLPLVAANDLQLGIALAIAGVSIAPSIAVQFTIMSTVAPEGAATEAFTWGSTANFVGLALGNVVAGLVVDRMGVAAGFVASVAAAGVAVVLALVFRSALGGDRVDESSADELLVAAEAPQVDLATGIPRLALAFLGYRRHDVDVTLATMREQHAALAARADDALHELAAVRAELEEVRGDLAAAERRYGSVTYASLARRMEAMLAQTDEACWQVRLRADAEAAALREAAEREATDIVARAHREATVLITAAQDDAAEARRRDEQSLALIEAEIEALAGERAAVLEDLTRLKARINEAVPATPSSPVAPLRTVGLRRVGSGDGSS
jgi:MFS family permease